MRSKAISIGCILALFFSCQRELILETVSDENLIVLNGILVADSAPISVSLHYSQALLDTLDSKTIDSALVKLYCNGAFVANMVYSGNGKYVYPSAPIPGNSYKIEATVGEKTVWAETTVPKPIAITEMLLDSIKSTLGNFYRPRYYISIDDKAEPNYYWFWLFSKAENNGEEVLRTGVIYSGSPNFDKFIAAKDPNSDIPYTLDYGTIARMPDSGFNGSVYRFDIVPQGISFHFVRIHANSFDEQYDKYLKSCLAYANYNSLMKDFAVYYKPSFVYSNVHNGTGILGSMSCYTKTFNQNEQ